MTYLRYFKTGFSFYWYLLVLNEVAVVTTQDIRCVTGGFSSVEAMNSNRSDPTWLPRPQEFMPENTQKARNGRVNYNDLTATSLEIMVNKGNHPQMALSQVSEIL